MFLGGWGILRVQRAQRVQRARARLQMLLRQRSATLRRIDAGDLRPQVRGVVLETEGWT